MVEEVMSDKRSVYLLTDGEYSDYHVVAVCSTEENAEKLNDVCCKGEGNVREWHLDDSVANLVDSQLLRFRVEMKRNGEVDTEYGNDEPCTIDTDDIKTYPPQSKAVASLQKWNDHPAELWVECWAKDWKHAVKIANEIRAQKIASGEWDKVERGEDD